MENFDKACGEMDYIINHMDSNFSNKIPDKLKDFFSNNKSGNNVNLQVDKPLYEQDLLEETKIYLQITYKLFIAPKKEKEAYIAESRKMFVQRNAENYMKKRQENYRG